MFSFKKAQSTMMSPTVQTIAIILLFVVLLIVLLFVFKDKLKEILVPLE